MTATRYDIWLSSPEGYRLVALGNWFSLDYTVAVNAITTASVVVPFSEVLWAKLRRDLRLEIYRNRLLETETCWFLRRWERSTDGEGRDTITLIGERANSLLQRRIVEYHAGSPEAQKEGKIDDIMHMVFEENMGGSARTSRGWSSFVTTGTSSSAAPRISKSFAKAPVFKLYTDLVEMSVKAGTKLYFDVVADATYPMLTFRTYIGKRGTDRSHQSTEATAVFIGGGFKNIITPKLVYDYTGEVTCQYVGGQGEEENRILLSVEDDTRIIASPFNRIEAFSDGKNTGAIDELVPQAYADLNRNTPKVKFTGSILDRENSRYGVDWFFGDIVSVSYYGIAFRAQVNAVSVTVNDQGETINTVLEGDLQ